MLQEVIDYVDSLKPKVLLLLTLAYTKGALRYADEIRHDLELSMFNETTTETNRFY